MSSNLRALWESAGGSTPEYWEFKKIEELLEHSKSISVGVMYPGLDTIGGVPLIKVSDVKNGAIVTQPEFCVSQEVDEEYKRTRLNGTELLITLVGNPGDCVIANSEMAGWNAARALAVVRLKDIELRAWLRYILLSKPAKHLIEARLNTTVQKTLNLKDIRELGLPIPPKNEREKITKVIDAIEDKVLLNRQTNQTLEQIAQAIFKSWFVDFEPTRAKIITKDLGGNEQAQELAAQAIICGALTLDQLAAIEPDSSSIEKALEQTLQNHATNKFPNKPGGLAPWQPEQLAATAKLFPNALVESELGGIPEGWGVTELGNILDFNPKRTLKKGVLAPYLDMKNVPTKGHLADDVYLREMASGTKFINGDTLLARITPCLENGKTAYVDFLEEAQVAWGSTEYIVIRPSGDRPLSLGYIIARLDSFRSKAIQTMTGTSGRQRANAKALSEQKWVNYPVGILEKYDTIAGTYLAKAKKNGDENKTLSELRDTLLPKLLSGDSMSYNTQADSSEAI